MTLREGRSSCLTWVGSLLIEKVAGKEEVAIGQNNFDRISFSNLNWVEQLLCRPWALPGSRLSLEVLGSGLCRKESLDRLTTCTCIVQRAMQNTRSESRFFPLHCFCSDVFGSGWLLLLVFPLNGDVRGADSISLSAHEKGVLFPKYSAHIFVH